jgi:hypothetical protein
MEAHEDKNEDQQGRWEESTRLEPKLAVEVIVCVPIGWSTDLGLIANRPHFCANT